MSIKCNKCGNNVFDSKAYLKISEIERVQQEIVSDINEELNFVKQKHGKKSDEAVEVSRRLNTEKRVLSVIWRCKNAL